MPTARIKKIYERDIKPLSVEERLELLALLANDLAARTIAPSEEPIHSIMELHGLGREIWEGVDAQAYVNRLRDEWERSA